MELSIKNSEDKIKIENVYCIGMNYHDHAKELGNKSPDEPVIFMKANSCLTKNKADFILGNELTHYEGELVVVIKNHCGRIPKDIAHSVILGYALGIDYTLRDIQSKAKSKGYPWTLSKSFYGSAPISDVVLKEDCNINDKDICLSINDDIRQQAKVSDMIFSIAHLISYLSYKVPLKKGDIIYTGTPKGVGQVHKGDIVKCFMDGIGELISYVK